MKDLIEALTIFLKYSDVHSPTNCDHDVLYVCVDPNVVSPEDKIRLGELSFIVDGYEEGFMSFRFGSC